MRMSCRIGRAIGTSSAEGAGECWWAPRQNRVGTPPAKELQPACGMVTTPWRDVFPMTRQGDQSLACLQRPRSRIIPLGQRPFADRPGATGRASKLEMPLGRSATATRRRCRRPRASARRDRPHMPGRSRRADRSAAWQPGRCRDRESSMGG
jgi:hypothetical protein